MFDRVLNTPMVISQIASVNGDTQKIKISVKDIFSKYAQILWWVPICSINSDIIYYITFLMDRNIR